MARKQSIGDTNTGAFCDSQTIQNHRVSPADVLGKDLDAFAEFYDQHSQQVFWYLLSLTGSEEDSADLTQHVFLRALESMPHCMAVSSPIAWLFRVARNAAIDTFRRSSHTLPWRHIDATVLPFGGPGPEAAALERETLNELRVLLGRLSPEKQEMLALRVAGGLTCGEIAAVIGKSEAAVKKELQRTIRALREQCNEE